MTKTSMCCLESVSLRDAKKFKPGQQEGSWYILGVHFKIFHEHPVVFVGIGYPPGEIDDVKDGL